MKSSELLDLELLANTGQQGKKSAAIHKLITEVRKLQRRRDPNKGPTLREVMEYAETIKMNSGEPEDFFDYYEIVGWKYGKARIQIRDWRAALRRWKKKASATPSQSKGTHGIG